MDYKTFLDLVLAMENKQTRQVMVVAVVVMCTEYSWCMFFTRKLSCVWGGARVLFVEDAARSLHFFFLFFFESHTTVTTVCRFYDQFCDAFWLLSLVRMLTAYLHLPPWSGVMEGTLQFSSSLLRRVLIMRLQALHYFWRVLDVQATGRLTIATINIFFRDVVRMLNEGGCDTPIIADVKVCNGARKNRYRPCTPSWTTKTKSKSKTSFFLSTNGTCIILLVLFVACAKTAKMACIYCHRKPPPPPYIYSASKRL